MKKSEVLQVYSPETYENNFYQRFQEPDLTQLPLESFVHEIAKAGFDLQAESKRKDRLQEKFGVEKGKKIWVLGVTDEVISHAFEYSRGDIVMFSKAYKIIDGRLYSPSFDEFLDSGIVNFLERGGSVLTGLKKVQDQINTLAENGFIIWSSPSGPLGINDLYYDYSWTHLFWRKEDDVYYVSLRTDFDLSEHAQFLNFFLPQDGQIDVLDPNKTQMDKIREILETPVVVFPHLGIRDLPEIAKKLGYVREDKNGIIYQDKQTGKKRYFKEMAEILERITIGQILIPEELQILIDYFERQLLREGLSSEQILRLIGQYLLTLNYFVKEGNSLKIIGRDTDLIYYLPQKVNSLIFLEEIQQVGGCGGGSTRQNTRTFTSHSSEKVFSGRCPVCGKYVTVALGEKCPHCLTVYTCG